MQLVCRGAGSPAQKKIKIPRWSQRKQEYLLQGPRCTHQKGCRISLVSCEHALKVDAAHAAQPAAKDATVAAQKRHLFLDELTTRMVTHFPQPKKISGFEASLRDANSSQVVTLQK